MKSLVLAEFTTEAAVLAAARALRERGDAKLDIQSPVPIHGAPEALGLKRSLVPLVALSGGVLGALTGYLIQYWTVGVDWPLNVGGRPPHSPPAFVPITFELGVLFSSLSIFFGLLFAFFGFPRVYHPVFEVEAFRSASVDGIWLSAEADQGRADAIAAELRRLGAKQVSIVPEVRA